MFPDDRSGSPEIPIVSGGCAFHFYNTRPGKGLVCYRCRPTMEEPFQLDFQVRDYECDLQGIVNNAVYQNYLEHARHEFLLARGLDFAALAAQGVRPVVVRAELDYKRALRPGDRFRVEVRCLREGRVRMVFLQEIVHADGAVVLSARIVATVLDARGRPRIPDAFERLFAANEPGL